MALTLTKTGITTGGTIQAYHVTQSIDAFSGTAAYNITLSGSLTLTGSVNSLNGFTGNLSGTASYADFATSTPQVTGYYIPSGSVVAAAGILKMFAGAGKTTATPPYIAIVTVSPVDLTGKILNQNLFLGVAPSQSGATVSATVNSPTSITFVSNVASTDFSFVATYI